MPKAKPLKAVAASSFLKAPLDLLLASEPAAPTEEDANLDLLTDAVSTLRLQLAPAAATITRAVCRSLSRRASVAAWRCAWSVTLALPGNGGVILSHIFDLHESALDKRASGAPSTSAASSSSSTGSEFDVMCGLSVDSDPAITEALMDITTAALPYIYPSRGKRYCERFTEVAERCLMMQQQKGGNNGSGAMLLPPSVMRMLTVLVTFARPIPTRLLSVAVRAATAPATSDPSLCCVAEQNSLRAVLSLVMHAHSVPLTRSKVEQHESDVTHQNHHAAAAPLPGFGSSNTSHFSSMPKLFTPPTQQQQQQFQPAPVDRPFASSSTPTADLPKMASPNSVVARNESTAVQQTEQSTTKKQEKDESANADDEEEFTPGDIDF